jgi:hypothetical protein
MLNFSKISISLYQGWPIQIGLWAALGKNSQKYQGRETAKAFPLYTEKYNFLGRNFLTKTKGNHPKYLKITDFQFEFGKRVSHPFTF